MLNLCKVKGAVVVLMLGLSVVNCRASEKGNYNTSPKPDHSPQGRVRTPKKKSLYSPEVIYGNSDLENARFKEAEIKVSMRGLKKKLAGIEVLLNPGNQTAAKIEKETKRLQLHANKNKNEVQTINYNSLAIPMLMKKVKHAFNSYTDVELQEMRGKLTENLEEYSHELAIVQAAINAKTTINNTHTAMKPRQLFGVVAQTLLSESINGNVVPGPESFIGTMDTADQSTIPIKTQQEKKQLNKKKRSRDCIGCKEEFIKNKKQRSSFDNSVLNHH